MRRGSREVVGFDMMVEDEQVSDSGVHLYVRINLQTNDVQILTIFEKKLPCKKEHKC